jgi:hypothetical protein
MELPRSWLYYITVEEMNFTVTETLRASRVEKWIRAVKQRFLDAAPIKCVGLDYEFTSPRDKLNQRAAVLQLSVASEVLIFPICWANHVPQLLKEFFKDTTIKFCSAAIANDVRMLRTYGIEIPSAYDLQKIVLNPTNKLTPSLYDLANATIGTHLEKKKRIKKDKKMDKKKDKKKEEEEGRRRRTNIWLGQSSIELRASVMYRSRRSPGLRDCSELLEAIRLQ